jgi:hypothetical protein
LQQLLLKVMVIQLALLIEVQLHPELQFTLTEALPPPEPKLWFVGDNITGGLVAVIITVAESFDEFGSVAEEATVAVLSIITLLGIEQLTLAKMVMFTDAPTSSELMENVTLLPALVHEVGDELQKRNNSEGGSSSLTSTEEARSGPLLVTVMV